MYSASSRLQTGWNRSSLQSFFNNKQIKQVESFLINFCRWNADQQSGKTERKPSNVNGFGSISRRQSCKPIIAAVLGGTYGGGTEIILNCDLVVASQDAKFALPEVKRGVVANQGGKYLS